MAYSKYRKNGELKKKPGRKPDPNKVKRGPIFVKGVERPHMWAVGPDPEKHKLYTPWMRAKAQANFREEGWTMTFDEFYEMWHPYWDQRGRQADDLCMSRLDWNQPWSKDNTYIITRQEHLINQGAMRIKRRDANLAKQNKPPKVPKPITYKKIRK